MSRIRTIKPDAFKSESLSTVPREMRWTFAGLWTYSDDAGRGRDDVRLIKAELYPLDDAVSLAVVGADLEHLAGIGCVCRYEADGRKYFHMPAWLEHQRINRPTPSKLPPCPKHDSAMSEPAPPEEDSMSDHGGLTEPSPPEGKGGEGNGMEQGGDGNARAKRGHQLPADWAPNEQHTQKALQLELDLAAEVEHFRDHATANGVTRKDWDAAFRMWLRNSAKWGDSKRNPNKSGPDWDAAMTRAGGRTDHLEIA